MTAYGVAFRLAFRDLVASRQRTGLIIALIAVPIFGVSSVATVLVQPAIRTSLRPQATGLPVASVTPGAELGVLSVIAGLAGLLVCLLAGSAFLVGALARLRQLATLASLGGTASTLIAATSATAPLLGLVGGVCGVLPGAAAGILVLWLQRSGDLSGTDIPWALLAGVVALAVASAWAASVVPSRMAANVDVVGTLRGASRPHITPRRSRGVGILAATIGAALCVWASIASIRTIDLDGLPLLSSSYTDPLALTGALLALTGLILLGPNLLGLLSRSASRVSVASRLGTRDASRNRARSIPVIAVIAGTTFLAIFVMISLASSQATTQLTYPYQTSPGQLQTALTSYPGGDGSTLGPTVDSDIDSAELAVSVVDAYGRALPPSSIAVIETASAPDRIEVPATSRCKLTISLNDQQSSVLSPSPNCRDSYVSTGPIPGFGVPATVVVGDEADLAVILGAPPNRQSILSLTHGGAVSLHRGFVADDGTVRFDAGGNASSSLQLAAVVQEPAHPLPYGIVISPQTARRLSIDFSATQVLASLAHPASTAELTDLAESLSRVPGAAGLTVNLESGPPTDLTWTWILFLGCFVGTVGAASVALALARFEARTDTRIFDSIGAPGALSRWIASWQAFALSATGTVLGGSVALVSGYAFNAPGSGSVLEIPWPVVAATMFGIPLVVAALACAARPSTPSALNARGE